MFTLQQDKPKQLQDYLQEQGWLPKLENIEKIEIPGAGNMNVTLRVATARRSLIVKQSLPYVAKYPQVEAPAERILREGEFYKLIRGNPTLVEYMPKLIGLDEKNHVMAMEDLGSGADFTFLYKHNEELEIPYLAELIHYITTLHGTINRQEPSSNLPNRAMRKLNHNHLFKLPFEVNNGFDLDDVQPGLARLARPLQNDALLRNEAHKLGELYLNDGNVLLHGDYFPGSWLQCKGKVKIIDPEFGFFGFAEFDLAVMQAHLKMAAQPDYIVEKAIALYQEKLPLDESLLQKYTGIEILRRLIGLAQLPLSLNVEQKKLLLEAARTMVIE